MHTSSPFPLRDLDIRHLMALQAVAEERSFGRAAQRLGFTQSAVSQQVAALERIVGTPLFDRPGGPKPVELTPAGQALLPHAEAVLERLHQASDDLEALAVGHRRPPRRSAPSRACRCRSCRRRSAACARNGRASRCASTSATTRSNCTTPSLSGEADLTFTEDFAIDARMTGLHLFDDPYVVMSPLEADPQPLVDLYTLHGAAMVSEHNSSCTLRIQRKLNEIGVVPNYVFRTSDNTALQAMVRAGMGHGIAALLAIDVSDPKIMVRASLPPLPSRSLGIAWVTGRTLSPSTERMIEIVQDVCAELVAERHVPHGLAAA